MNTPLVCERWPLPITATPGGEHRWFLDWALTSQREVSTHVTAGYAALRALADTGAQYGTALELFGGLGCQSLIIRHLFAPRLHTVLERHPAAVTHLRRLLNRPGETVMQADTYTADLPDAELVGADFGDLTALSAQRGHAALLDRVFEIRPTAVLLTDIAGPRLALHRRRYSDLLGTDCTDYPAYLNGLADWLWHAYGYGTLAVYHHRWSAVMALVARRATPVIAPVPERPRGLTL